MTIPQRPGRGRKQCPDCQLYQGVRNRECNECGYNFNQSAKPTADVRWDDSLEQKERRLRYTLSLSADFDTVILTPSGECPAKLNDCNDETVFKWCEEVTTKGLSEGKIYTEEALKYYLRSFVSVNSEEYEFASALVEEWTDTVINCGV